MRKNASDNIPAFQFYPNDWLSDVNLRMCSLPARGLWIDLVCLMYRTKKIGYLVHKVGQKWINFDSKMVQKVTGISQKKVEKLLQELLDNDVLKTAEDGLYYSKRIVKEQELSNVRREAGKKGGNPNLINQKDKQKGEQKQTPSSSTSFSSSTSKPKKKTIKEINLPTWLPKETWKNFLDMRKAIKKPATPKAQELLIKKLTKLKEEGQVPNAILEQSIINSWQNVFPVKENNRHEASGRSNRSMAGPPGCSRKKQAI